MKYKLGDGSWQDTVPTATSVGTYTVYYKASGGTYGGTTYSDSSEGSVEVTISKASNPLTFSNQNVSKSFSTSAQTATLTGASNVQGTVSYAIQSGNSSNYFSLNGTQLTIAANTPVGTYTLGIRATAAGNSNYNSGTKDSTVTVTVGKAGINPSVSMTGWTYGSTASNPSVSGNPGNGTPTYQYKVSTEADSAYSNTKPSNAGTYTVKATIPATINYNGGTATANFTISPKTVSNPTIELNQSSYTYDGNEKKPAVVVKDGSTVIQADEYTASYSNNKNAGTATVTITDKANGNYTVSGSKNFTINKAASSASAPSAIDLTYNTNPQALVNAGTASGGTLMYKVTTEDSTPATNTDGWRDSVPEMTNAGTYYVWYYVKGDSNHNDSAVEKVAVEIKQADNSINAPAARSGLTYTSKAQSLVTKGSAAHGTLYYAVGDSALAADSSDWSTVIPKGTDAGTYKVWTMAKDAAGNYKTVISATPVEVTIAKKSISSATIVLDKTSVPDTATNPNVTVVIAGSLVVPADEYDSACTVDSDNIGTVTVTVKDISENFTGSATTDYVVGTDIRDAVVTLDPETESYRAEQIRPHVTVVYEGEELIEGTDYRLEYGENTAVGMGAVTIIGKGTYAGKITKNFVISARDIASVQSEAIADVTFDNTEKEPVPVLKNGDDTLRKDTDFYCYYNSNKDPGQARVVVVGKGNYSDSRVLNFNIIGQLNNSSYTSASVNKTIVLNDNNTVTTDSFRNADIDITFNGKKLTLDTDYIVKSVEYPITGKHKQGTVTLEGKAFYKDTVTIPFTARNANQKLTVTNEIAEGITVSGVTASENIYTLAVESSYTITNNTGKILTLTGQNPVTLGIGESYVLTVTDEVNYQLAVHDHPYAASVAENGYQLVIGCAGNDLDVLTLAEINTDTEYTFGNTIDPGVTLTERYGKNAEINSVKVYNSSDQEITATALTGGTVPVGTYTVAAVVTYNGATYTLKKQFTISARAYTDTTEYSISAPALTFNGGAQTPTFTITRSGIALIEGTDFDFGWSDGGAFKEFDGAHVFAQTNAGTYSVAIKFKGNYTGETTADWTINRLMISENSADTASKLNVSEITAVTYNRAEQTPEPTLVVGNATLVKGTDYTLSYVNNVNAGTANVTIKPVDISNYSFTEFTKQFTINPKQVTPTIVLGNEVLTYDGNAKEMSFTVKDGDAETGAVIDASEYTYSYTNNTLAGTGTATVTVTNNADKTNGNYIINEASANYSIAKANILTDDVTPPTAVNGLVYAPEASYGLVNAGSVTGNIGTIWYRLGNYSAWSEDIPTGTNASTYTIYWYVKGDNNHNDLGSEDAPFGTIDTASIAEAAISVEAVGYEGAYDGQAHGISVNVTNPEGVTISYSTKADGTYSEAAVTFTDFTDGAQTVYYKVEKENYVTATGYATVNITKKDVTVTPDAEQTKVFGETDPTFTYTSVGLVGEDTVSGTLSRAVGENFGKYAFAIGTLDAGSNYQVQLATGEDIPKFEITAKSISSADVILNKTAFDFGDTPYEPNVDFVIMGSTILIKGTDYTVSYENNNSAGTGSVVIKGINNYTEEYRAYFIIGTDLTNAEITVDTADLFYDGSEKRPAVTVIYGSNTVNADNYEVNYSENINAGTAVVTITGKAENGYTGTASATFEIAKARIATAEVTGTFSYTGTAIIPATIVVKDANESVIAPENYDIEYINNTKVGTAYVIVTAKKGTNYTGTADGTFVIDHAYTAVAEVNASCGAAGVKAHWTDENGAAYLKNEEGAYIPVTAAQLAIAVTGNHDYGTENIQWYWTNDNQAVAIFKCDDCGAKTTVNAAVVPTRVANGMKYTATVTFEEEEYSTSKTVQDTYITAFSEITDWQSANTTGGVIFSYRYNYEGDTDPVYGFLCYRDGVLDKDMTVGMNGVASVIKTAATGTIGASDKGTGIYLRPYIQIGEEYVYGEQVFVKHSDLMDQKAYDEATTAITGYVMANSTGGVIFNYSNTYGGNENAEYGFLCYRDGVLNKDMTVDMAGIASVKKTAAEGTLGASDKGNGIYLRPYIKIGDKYKYGDQVYVKHSELMAQKAFDEAASKITGYTIANKNGGVIFNYSNTYSGNENAEYGFLCYRDGVMNENMTVGMEGIASIKKTTAEGTLGASDKGNGIYLRSYIKIGDKYKYGDQVYVKHSELLKQETLAAATSKITGFKVANSTGGIIFSYKNTYDGPENAVYGFLCYRDGELDKDMTVGMAGVASVIKTAATGTIGASDNGTGIYLRPYIQIGENYVYGDQV
ncbi:MBG domain-containing protein, partial [Ruminococcus flavefaciens]